MDKKFYWDNGKLKEQGRVMNGKAEGRWTYYYESGEKQSETNFIDDVRHGYTVHYWPNGLKKDEGVYLDGKLQGKWTAWFENGQKEREGNLEQGKETAMWYTWDRTGQKTGDYYYGNGQLNGWSTLYDSSGSRESRFYIGGVVKSYVTYTPEGFASKAEVLMRKDELPPMDSELVGLHTNDTVLKPREDYTFEILVPGVPFESISVSVTNATVRKGGVQQQYVLNAKGSGDVCVRLYYDLSNGERVELGPQCFPVTRK